MAAKDTQETLDHLLEELRSGEPARCLTALQLLDTLNFSSQAIIWELEKIAIHNEDQNVRASARQSLDRTVHRTIRARVNHLNRFDRTLMLKEIAQWEQERLLDSEVADVIKKRYNFDLTPAPPRTAPSPKKEVSPNPAPSQPASTGPRPSLTQTLLSEASIRIYLYLGAFFVIAAALILAAVVEAARLPILAVATLAFGGTALLLRRRLPQPSFALFIVFSFLLPIDANVLEETIGFHEPALSIYWTVIFLIMAAIWGWSIWFYESSFFSAVAFVSLSLAFYRFGRVFNNEIELPIFLGMLASLVGWAGTYMLYKWKNPAFSRPLFFLTQLQVAGLLFLSLIFNISYAAGLGSGEGWPLVVPTWIAGAVFYALSGILYPNLPFHWLAVAALLPLPWFLLNDFEAARSAYAFGFLSWGTVLATTSEAAFRRSVEKIKKYHWPLLAASGALFLASCLFAALWNTTAVAFSIFALIALVSAALHWIRPRAYVWSAALLAGVFAFFTFFSLPAVEQLEVPFVYQVLIASLLLVGPELFTSSPLSLKAPTRFPAIVFGVFISLLGITLALSEFENTGRGAIVMFVFAGLFLLHGLHTKREWLGYFAAALGSLAVVYALDHFSLDMWLPALTLLALIYYTTGFVLRQRVAEFKAWGNILIHSGLTLGILLSLTSLLLSKETSGWYIVLIALLFILELFTRPLSWLELIVEALLTAALYLILDDFGVASIGHLLFGATLIWLGGDLLFGRLLPGKQMYRPLTLGAGFTFTFMGMLSLWGESNPALSAVYYSLYALFFVLYAVLQSEPRLGYFAAAFLSLAVLKFCEAADLEKWMFPLIALAVLYYTAGTWLRRNHRAAGWDLAFLNSGLALGVLTSIAAPFQGGLEASIPVAIAATLFAMEAYALRSVWWALPANALYLMSYFMILLELEVDQPQFYSIGTALIGMVMHVLLTRAGSRAGAFAAGMLSQLVLLGTTYIQMVATERLSFFFVLFIQSMIVLVYGLIQRSRSLVITPIAFAVIGVMTVVYSALKGLGPVILIGSTGLVLLMAGIVAVLMRERITKLGEQLSEWKP